jgi:hypothetical protein
MARLIDRIAITMHMLLFFYNNRQPIFYRSLLNASEEHYKTPRICMPGVVSPAAHAGRSFHMEKYHSW